MKRISKKLMAPLVLALALTVSGCTTETQFGECKGFFNEPEKDPTLVYHVSTWNVIMAIVFSETLFLPLVTGGFWLWCPTGKVSK